MKLRKVKKKEHKKQQQKQKIKRDRAKKKKKKKVDSDGEDVAATRLVNRCPCEPVIMVLPRVVEDTPEIVSTILPDLEMLPEVHASKPSWLMRRSRTPSPGDKDHTKRQQLIRETRQLAREPCQQPVREPYLQSKTNKVS